MFCNEKLAWGVFLFALDSPPYDVGVFAAVGAAVGNNLAAVLPDFLREFVLKHRSADRIFRPALSRAACGGFKLAVIDFVCFFSDILHFIFLRNVFQYYIRTERKKSQ